MYGLTFGVKSNISSVVPIFNFTQSFVSIGILILISKTIYHIAGSFQNGSEMFFSGNNAVTFERQDIS